MILKIKALSPYIGAEIPLPYYTTPGAAAMDLHACIDEDITLPPLGRALVQTGIAIELPEGYAAFVFARSGLATKYGVCLSNSVGVIDSDYRGEVKVGLINLSNESYTVRRGDRIAQMSVMRAGQAQIELAPELSDTSRGAGGFGSTGISL